MHALARDRPQVGAEIGQADHDAEHHPDCGKEERRHVGRARGAPLHRLQNLPDRLAIVIGGALRRPHLFDRGGRGARPTVSCKNRSSSIGGALRLGRRRAGRSAATSAVKLANGSSVAGRRRGRFGRRAVRRRVLPQVQGLLDRRHRGLSRILYSLRIVRHDRCASSTRYTGSLPGRVQPLSRTPLAREQQFPSPSRPIPARAKRGSPPLGHPNALRHRMKLGSVTRPLIIVNAVAGIDALAGCPCGKLPSAPSLAVRFRSERLRTL